MRANVTLKIQRRLTTEHHALHHVLLSLHCRTGGVVALNYLNMNQKLKTIRLHDNEWKESRAFVFRLTL